MNQVDNSPNAEVMTVNGTRSFFIAMNNEGDIFDDVLVRQAVAHAIDRDLIIDRILNGTADADRGYPEPRRLRQEPRACRSMTTIRNVRARCWPRPAIPTGSR
jgi:ABC-type transport system substrate-binding protein